jgi:hypothetical protein
MTLEEQIKALLEAKEAKKDDDNSDQGDQQQADRVDDEPAVKIENPMNPDLTSSEVGEEPQDEIAAAEKQGEEDEEEEEEKEKVAESISDLLGDEFSADFKLKAQTIFEAAVKDQVMKIEAKLQEEQNAAVAKLQEEFNEKFATRSKQLEEETSDKIDGYLSFLAEEWKKDNEIALEAAIKSELTESFMNNLKAVFEQHYIDLPDDKVDLYNKTLEEKTEMETVLATTVGNLAKLTEELNQIKRDQIIEESAKEFSSLDAARFKTLTEDFAFENEESFKTKLSIVKKSFFGQKSTASEQLVEEFVNTPEIVETNSPVETVTENTAMSAYLRALRKK